MIETAKLHRPGGGASAKTITIRPSGLQPHGKQQPQQIIVIPQSMLVNGCISSKDLKSIISTTDSSSPSIKSMENRTDLKRPASSAEDSTYGSDSEISEHSDKPTRKRANLDHLSPDEKLMRRKLKNRVAAQNARDKKRVRMEEMEGELQRLKDHAKALEKKNAELVAQNERLMSENDRHRSSGRTAAVRVGQEADSPLVVTTQPPESSEGTRLSSLGRWTIGLNSLVDNGLETIVECHEGQQAAEEVTNQEASSPMADVVGKIFKSEDFAVDEEDTKACEQFLDNFLGNEVAEQRPTTILDTAWDETLGDLDRCDLDLFPDLAECTF